MLDAVRSDEQCVVQKKKKDKRRNEKIGRLTLTLERNDITPGQFLEAMSLKEDNTFPIIGKF